MQKYLVRLVSFSVTFKHPGSTAVVLIVLTIKDTKLYGPVVTLSIKDN